MRGTSFKSLPQNQLPSTRPRKPAESLRRAKKVMPLYLFRCLPIFSHRNSRSHRLRPFLALWA
jgi:hypothetical protein